jgi:hypothetical protein
MIGPRLCLAALLVSAPLAAATPPAAATAEPSDPALAPDSDAGPEPIPAAVDTLGGHLLLAAGPLGSVPFARLDGRTDFSDVAGVGVGIAGDAGIGLARSLAIGGWFEYVAFGSPSGCSACDATSLAVGPYVRYHLVQGTRFDPRISLGLGYRSLRATSLTGARRYGGIDWLKLELGGDWYALSQVGVGPFAELTFGTFTDRPGGNGGRVYGTFNFGVRLLFDVQGK